MFAQGRIRPSKITSPFLFIPTPTRFFAFIKCAADTLGPFPEMQSTRALIHTPSVCLISVPPSLFIVPIETGVCTRQPSFKNLTSTLGVSFARRRAAYSTIHQKRKRRPRHTPQSQ